MDFYFELNGTPTEYSLAEWAERYLDHSEKHNVRKVYQEKVKAFREFFARFDPTLGPFDLQTGKILSHFGDQAEKRSGNAANKDRKDLIAAWNWAVKYMVGWPRDNPFRIVDRQLEQRMPRCVPTVEDFLKVHDNVTGQDQVMLLTYLYTGARRSEIFSLLVDDVDLAGKRLRLWTRKRKGGKESDWIPFTTELHTRLKWWLEPRPFPEYEHVFVCEEDTPFCSEYYDKPFKERRHWLKRECERAGVKPFGFHGIRHLTASILDDAGYPITVIQAILRHKNANTTAKYLHNMRGIRVALDEAFKRNNRPKPAVVGTGRSKLRLVR